MFKLFSIKAKIFVMIIIVVIPIFIFEGINIKQNLSNSIEYNLQSNIDLAETVSNSLLEYIEDVWIKEADISIYIVSNPNLSSEQISEYLREVMKNRKIIEMFAWISPEGVVSASSNEEALNLSLNQREYVKKIQQGNEQYLSNLITSAITQKPVLPVTRGIKKDGELKGIMLAVVNIEKLGEKFSGFSFKEGDVFQIIDGNGMILYRNDIPNIYMEQKLLPENSQGWKALKGELNKTRKIISEFDGSVRMSIEYPINEIGWGITISSRYDVILQDDYIRIRNSVIILLLILLVSGIITFFIGGRYIAGPIYKLRRVAETVGEGNLTIRADVSGNDEIAITAKVFNKMVDSIEQHDSLKTQFFSNISHELKTPINVIFATSQLLAKPTKTTDIIAYQNKVQHHMNTIRQNCYRLIKLINNIIDINRLESGFLKANLINYNIVELVENIITSIVEYGLTKGITILFDTDTEEKMIACDPDMIERIILNLLSNAIKFTDFGGNISVNLYDKGDHVLISVKDNGIGIPKDKLEWIFERFKQVESSLNRNHEGSGIGLSLVKALVETHKGKVSILSEIGEGTEIIIDLPVILLPESEYAMDNNKKKSNLEQVHIERVNIQLSDIYFD